MIVPLVKITLCGLTKEKEKILANLQDMGCLHLIAQRLKAETGLEGGPSPRAMDALRFLLSSPHKRKQIRDPEGFDAVAVEQKAHELQDRIQTLADERDFLRGRIEDLRPWGNFRFPPREDLKNLRLWFYIVPYKEMQAVEATDLTWEVVHRDTRFSYVVVISKLQPQGMPVPRTRTGNKPVRELEKRLDEVELELEDVAAERDSLTRWCSLFARNLGWLEDRAARADAAATTYDDDPVFALQAWAPREKASQLREYTEQSGLVLQVEEPTPEDKPPTLLHNTHALSSAQDLVTFYTTPAYRLWDPSGVVFLSFALFFAIILSDAGYSLLMAACLAAGWKNLGRSEGGRKFRIMLVALIGASVVWGAMVGSYFGVQPSEGNPLSGLKILDLNDFDTMMRLSILIGILHLVWANLGNAWNWRGTAAAVTPIGWVLIFLGGTLVWLGEAVVKTGGVAAMVAGCVILLLFSVTEGPVWKRLLGGLQVLTRLSSAFGDTLSYLRLFALGLASASLALTFNDLAAQVGNAVPGVGFLLAILILLFGHAINLALGLSAGVIHGLRLNLIEFFNWSVTEEGYLFELFARKGEGSSE